MIKYLRNRQRSALCVHKKYVLNVNEIEKALFCREKQCVFLINQTPVTRIVQEFSLCFIIYSGYQFIAGEMWTVEPNLKYIQCLSL